MGDSVFDMSEMLESINGGVDRYDMAQVYPISGNINGSVVGQGQAQGLTVFQWQDSVNWWSPAQSYFSLILTFRSKAAVPTAASLVTYADNFVCTLFSQLQSYINSRPLDTVNTPHLIDTALTYSNAKQNFLKTWGSLTRVGEPLSTRLINVQANGGVIEVVFRPPLSIFDTKLLPPGAQFKLEFNWANNGINAFEALNSSLSWDATDIDMTDGKVSIRVNSFSFYKATVHPGPSIAIPPRGVIDLMPCQALQYFVNSGNSLKQNITIPGSTNRILVVFQDINSTSLVTAPTVPPVNNICGVGNGYNPATSFSSIFTTGIGENPVFGANTTGLLQLWISLPELGIQEPQPIYSFSGVQDYMRAYGDWCHITQGTHNQTEGSIPFGNNDPSRGTTIIQPLLASATTTPTLSAGTIQSGDLNNPQQYTYIPAVAFPGTAANALTYNQTTRWGWSGRCPGPIFAFPVVRPEGRTVSTGTLNVVMGAMVTSVCATIIASYSMAIILELQPSGYYSYTLMEGV